MLYFLKEYFLLRKKIKISAIFFFITIVFVATGCHKKDGLGNGIVPQEPQFAHRTIEYNNFVTETSLSDSVVSDDINCPTNFLGSFNDSKLGLLQSSFITQFSLPDNDVDIQEIGTQQISTFDYVTLSLAYSTNHYGRFEGTDTLQRLQIYELSKSLSDDSSYFSNTNASYYVGTNAPLFDDYVGVKPINGILKISLPFSYFNKFLLPSNIEYFKTNEDLLKIFKGLYFKVTNTSKPTGTGNFCSFDLRNANTKLEMGYTVNSNNTSVSRIIALKVSSQSRRVNIYNSSSKSLLTNLNLDKNNVYIQGFASTNAKIYCNPFEIFKDSTGIAIVNAKLKFDINETLSNNDNIYYPNIVKLKLFYIGMDNESYFLKDEVISGAYNVDGSENRTQASYTFNIGLTLQTLINLKQNIKGFLITCDKRNSVASKVVLKGGNNIKLTINYTKF